MKSFYWKIYCILQEKVRGPNLEFEHLEKELSNSSVWPPLGKNNDIKVGESSKLKNIFNLIVIKE